MATAIIKAVNAVPFILATASYNNKKAPKIVNVTTLIMTVVSGLITIFGYLLAEGIMYSFPSALTSVPFSIVQAVGSAVIFAIVGKILDQIKIHKYL